MSRIVTAFATIRLNLLVPDDMEDQQVLDEFFQSTQASFEETENVEVEDIEFIDLSTESVFDEDYDDLDGEDIDEIRGSGKGFSGFIS